MASRVAYLLNPVEEQRFSRCSGPWPQSPFDGAMTLAANASKIIHSRKGIGSHCCNDLRHDCVPELAIGLGVRHCDIPNAFDSGVEPHQACAFQWCQSSWSSSWPAIDEYFRAVLVITGAQGPCDIFRVIVRCDHPEPKPVAFASMLVSVILQVCPKLFAEDVLFVNLFVGFEDVIDRWPLLRGCGKAEWLFSASEDSTIEADDEDSFPMLGNPSSGIDDLRVHLVVEFVEFRPDDLPGAALVMGLEVLDVLENEDRGTLLGDDVADPEEEVPLAFTLETMLLAQ